MRPDGHVTTREAARILGIGREGAARVLASGLAGPPLRCGRATLYPAGAIRALAARPEVDAPALHLAFPDGLLVGRLDPRRGNPHGPWVVSPLRIVGLRWIAERNGPTPMICTVNGFVLGAYEVVGHAWLPVRAPRERRLTFDLRDPGPWSAVVLGRRFVTPPGHALWTWRSEVLPQLPRWPRDHSHLQGPGIRRSRPRAAAG
jgi:hypothetical protein